MDWIFVRSAVLRIVFVVVLVLIAVAGTAHASPAAPPADAQVAGALFTPTRTDDGIDWTAHWVLTPDATADVARGDKRAVRFALALGDGESLEPSEGVAPLVEAGRVTGVVVDGAALDGRTVRAVVHQRARHEGAIRLGAPVAAGHAFQIVDGDLGGGTLLEFPTGRLLERNVGSVAPPGTSHAVREEARRLTGYDARVTGAPLYIRGDDVRAANGFSATIVTARARGRGGFLAIGAVFVMFVGALLVATRRLRHAASIERADALLAADLDALEHVVGARRSVR